MKKSLFNFSMILAVTLSLGVFAFAQQTTTTTTVTKKEVVANPDGTYSVIEYPVGKEVTVELMPNDMEGAKGFAKVMRTDDGTNIALDLSGLPADAKDYYVYAVDNAGAVTLLGPATVENGMVKTTYNTPMSQFMIFLSPNEALTAMDAATPVVFRSAVPKGYAVVPVGNRMEGVGDVKEKQDATSTAVTSTYNVPLLGVPAFDKKTTSIAIEFSGDLEGLKGKVYIDKHKDGTKRIKMRFDDMKMAPKNKKFVLWASAPDGSYTKLGQVINTGERQEAEVRSETALKDFGLFVTVEDQDVTTPTSKIYSSFRMKGMK
ncbi:MAG: hypothetical protein ABIP06_05405 [Pyrinomonadaceae bacterium]